MSKSVVGRIARQYLQIQVVGGLVQQQQSGLDEEGLGQRHAHAPPTGQILGHLVHHLVREA
jgi:hypothetical protein